MLHFLSISDNSRWSEFSRLFDAVEAHLRVRLGERDLTNSTAYQQANEDSSPDWPLLQALLQVNLLPFALTANLQLLIEVCVLFLFDLSFVV